MSVFKNIRIRVYEAFLASVIKHLLSLKIIN